MFAEILAGLTILGGSFYLIRRRRMVAVPATVPPPSGSSGAHSPPIPLGGLQPSPTSGLPFPFGGTPFERTDPVTEPNHPVSSPSESKPGILPDWVPDWVGTPPILGLAEGVGGGPNFWADFDIKVGVDRSNLPEQTTNGLAIVRDFYTEHKLGRPRITAIRREKHPVTGEPDTGLHRVGYAFDVGPPPTAPFTDMLAKRLKGKGYQVVTTLHGTGPHVHAEWDTAVSRSALAMVTG